MDTEVFRVNGRSCFEEIHDKNGIWFPLQEEEVTGRFTDQKQDDLFDMEDTSWWFQYRADMIGCIAEEYFHKEQCIFDVGGGNGYTTFYLQNKGFCMALLEPSYAACRHARERGVETVFCGSLEHRNVRDNSVAQFMLLDVLEHIEDDAAFLKLMYQKLAPGGRVFLTVPAFQALWSSEDDAGGHYRRYTVKQIKKAAVCAGFHVCRASYFFSFLFFPILLGRVGLERTGFLKRYEERTEEEKKAIRKKQFKKRKGMMQMVLYLLEKAELHHLMKHRRMWLGSSIFCVLEKIR